MHTQFMLAAWKPEITNVHLWVAVAILACVVVAELFGIGVLLFKILGSKKKDGESEEDEQYGQYGFAPVLALTALSPVAYSLIDTLLIASAVLGVVLVALIVVSYARGVELVRAVKRE